MDSDTQVSPAERAAVPRVCKEMPDSLKAGLTAVDCHKFPVGQAAVGFRGLTTHLEKYQLRCKSKYIWGWRVTRITMIGKDC